MRPIDQSLIPEGMLALLTVRDLAPDSKLFMADFRDLHGLSYRGHLLGINKSGEVRFGMRPLSMVDGVWLMREDIPSQTGNQNLRALLDDLTMEIIR